MFSNSYIYSIDLEGNVEELYEYKIGASDKIAITGAEHFNWNGKEAFFYNGVHLLDYNDFSITTLCEKSYQDHFLDYETGTVYATGEDWNNGPSNKLLRIEKNGIAKELFKDFHHETQGKSGRVVFVKGKFVWISAYSSRYICTMDLNGKIKKI